MGRVRKVKRFGWIPDLPDQRDHLYSAPLSALRELPEVVDLRANCPPVSEQGDLGSCTADVIAAAIRFSRMKSNFAPDFAPSRLFIYYNERAVMGDEFISQDSGAHLRDGLKTVAQDGVCSEQTGIFSEKETWRYNVSRFHVKPPAECYERAREYQVINYSRISQSPLQMRACLATGFPFIFGATIYESFLSPAVRQTGNVPLPGDQESVVGGHALMAVGYDDSRRVFIVRNSWGEDWGDRGYGYMPYSYLTDQNLSKDFWTIRLIEE